MAHILSNKSNRWISSYANYSLRLAAKATTYLVNNDWVILQLLMLALPSFHKELNSESNAYYRCMRICKEHTGDFVYCHNHVCGQLL